MKYRKGDSTYRHLMPNDIDTAREVMNESVPIAINHLTLVPQPERVAEVLAEVHARRDRQVLVINTDIPKYRLIEVKHLSRAIISLIHRLILRRRLPLNAHLLPRKQIPRPVPVRRALRLHIIHAPKKRLIPRIPRLSRQPRRRLRHSRIHLLRPRAPNPLTDLQRPLRLLSQDIINAMRLADVLEQHIRDDGLLVRDPGQGVEVLVRLVEARLEEGDALGVNLFDAGEGVGGHLPGFGVRGFGHGHEDLRWDDETAVVGHVGG
jgi:hypothetical protein